MSSKKNVKIRQGTQADIGKVAAIVKKVWSMGGDYLMEQKYGRIGNKSWDEWISEDVTKYITDELEHFLAADCDSELAGFISYRLDSHRQIGTIGYNAVHPEFRGRGIGTLLLNRVLTIIKEEGMLYSKVITGLNEGHSPARKMYEKAGFEELTRIAIYNMKL